VLALTRSVIAVLVAFTSANSAPPATTIVLVALLIRRTATKPAEKRVPLSVTTVVWSKQIAGGVTAISTGTGTTARRVASVMLQAPFDAVSATGVSSSSTLRPTLCGVNDEITALVHCCCVVPEIAEHDVGSCSVSVRAAEPPLLAVSVGDGGLANLVPVSVTVDAVA
jgi:hypothetical protein